MEHLNESCQESKGTDNCLGEGNVWVCVAIPILCGWQGMHG